MIKISKFSKDHISLGAIYSNSKNYQQKKLILKTAIFIGLYYKNFLLATIAIPFDTAEATARREDLLLQQEEIFVCSE